MSTCKILSASLGLLIVASVSACSSPVSEPAARKSEHQTQGPLIFDLSVNGSDLRLVLRSASSATASDYQVWEPGPHGQLVERKVHAPSCLYEADVYDPHTNQLLPDAYAALSTCVHTLGYAEPTLYGLVAAFGRTWSISPAPGDTDAHDGITHELRDNAALRAQAGAVAPLVTSVRRTTAVVPQTVAFREGTPAETKYVELMVVNDPERLALFNGDSALMLADSVAIMTAANTIYARSGLEPRVRIAVVGQVTLPPGAYPVQAAGPGEVSSQALLDAFSTWSMEQLPAHDDHCLLSGHDFDQNTVGLAYLAGMCSGAHAGLVAQTVNLSAAIPEVVVHELGHNLGMPHDSEENTCPGSGYLMAAYAQNGGLNDPQFSTCSQDYYSSFLDYLGELGAHCLENVPSEVALDQCGDGVVSGTERCDCGAADCSTIDPCCDGSSCQLSVGAVCSDFNDLCCSQCQAAPKTQQCRSARDSCDTAEMCNGYDSTCPGDLFSASGLGCTLADGTTGACFAGSCTSRDVQCRALGPQVGTPLQGPGPDCPTTTSCSELLCSAPDFGACVNVEGLTPVDGSGCGDGKQCVDAVCVDSTTIDDCPLDADKTVPGLCGCGIADTDTDQDGTADCVDRCLNDPLKVELGSCGCDHPEPNATGITSCSDECPTSIEKESPGDCGCDTPDTDQDLDQLPDCIDPCPSNPHPAATPQQSCITPTVDETTTTESTDGPGHPDATGSGGGSSPNSEPNGKDDKKGCGCRMEAHHEPRSFAHYAAFLALAWVSWRRRARGA